MSVSSRVTAETTASPPIGASRAGLTETAGFSPGRTSSELRGTPFGTTPDGALYNQVIDGHNYFLQQLYSHQVDGCVQRKALPPAVTKLSPAHGSLAGGTKVKVTSLNFQNPTVTTVGFGKAPATSFKVGSPTSIAAVSPAAAFTGPGTVTLTSTRGASTSVPAGQFTYEENRGCSSLGDVAG